MCGYGGAHTHDQRKYCLAKQILQSTERTFADVGSLSNQDIDGWRITASPLTRSERKLRPLDYNSYAVTDTAPGIMLGSISRLLVQPINDSRFYRITKVSFLPTESLHNLQSQSPLNLV